MGLQSITRETKVRLGAGLFVSLLSAAIGLLLIWPSDPTRWGNKMGSRSYDLLFKFKAQETITNLVLVYMDDNSHQQLAQPYDRPWDRALYARLLDKLTTDKANAVAFDIVFSGRHGEKPDGDLLFAQAIKKNGRVILGGEIKTNPRGEDPVVSRADEIFFEAAAQPIGLVQIANDQDFMARRHVHVPLKNPDFDFPSLSWSAATLAGTTLDQSWTNRAVERWINYYGPPGAIASISFHAALDVGPGFFSNKVVFIGARLNTFYSGQRKDELITPYTKDTELIPAVDVQATQCVNLMRGDWLRRPSPIMEQALIFFAALALGFGLIFLRPFHALLAGVLAIGTTVLIARHFFLHHLVWFPWFIVAAVQVPLAALWSWGFNSFRLYVNNRLLEQSLSSYVSPARVKEVLQQPDKLKPGAEKTELSILFSDIAGFTTISEGMDSDELARIMNAYFEGAVSRIHETDGTVVKFIGDAIFAIWNAPLLQADHQYHAALAGLRLSGAVDEFIKSGGPELITRIGLHCGVANVGNFGSTKRFDYTAIGENINLASRMESLNKYLGTTVLGTGDIQALVGDRLVWRYIGKFQLKGFDRAVAVFELVGEPKDAETSRAWREEFARAFAAFLKRDFATAKTGFEKVVTMRGKDGPSSFYLKYLEEHPHPPGPDWNGDIEMKEK